MKLQTADTICSQKNTTEKLHHYLSNKFCKALVIVVLLREAPMKTLIKKLDMYFYGDDFDQEDKRNFLTVYAALVVPMLIMFVITLFW